MSSPEFPLIDVNGKLLEAGQFYQADGKLRLVPRIILAGQWQEPACPDPLAAEAEAYPAYWKPLPKNWTAIDYYRVRELFPLPPELASARLDHSLKKLLVPGVRTGGKSFYKDIKEAHATLGQWLKDHEDLADAPVHQ